MCVFSDIAIPSLRIYLIKTRNQESCDVHTNTPEWHHCGQSSWIATRPCCMPQLFKGSELPAPTLKILQDREVSKRTNYTNRMISLLNLSVCGCTQSRISGNYYARLRAVRPGKYTGTGRTEEQVCSHFTPCILDSFEYMHMYNFIKLFT